MRTQVMWRLLAPLMGLTIALTGQSAPAYAGEDKGLCDENHSRGTIPGDFPLDACFDGKTLTIKNGTQFPLVLSFTGNDVGSVQLESRSAGALRG